MVTTNDVAEALVTLTAAVANDGRADAVSFPICVEETGAIDKAQLVIGVGNDVLSAPVEWDHPEPDFSAGAEELRAHPNFPRSGDAHAPAQPVDDPDANWDPDLDGFTRAEGQRDADAARPESINDWR